MFLHARRGDFLASTAQQHAGSWKATSIGAPAMVVPTIGPQREIRLAGLGEQPEKLLGSGS